MIALGLTWKRLPAAKLEQIKPTPKPSVCFVTETLIDLCMPSTLISGGPLLTLLCSVRARHSLRLLVGVADWCVSRLVRLKWCRKILTASSRSRESVDLPLTCDPSPSLITIAFRSSEVRCLLFFLDPYGYTEPLSMFIVFLRELLMFSPHVIV